MNEDRGPWYLLTGIVIGVALGLVYAWKIDPVVYEKTSPASLQAEYKDQYRALIAAAFAASGNLPRAQARLALLGEEDPARVVAVQAQRALAENRPPAEARALGLLAVALSQGDLPPAQPAAPAGDAPSLTLPTPGGATAGAPGSPVPPENFSPPPPTASTTLPSPSSTATSILRTPNPTITPLPTRTPTATPGAPFVLKDMDLVCDSALGQPLIIVEALDKAGNPVPGAEVVVQWEGNEDRFFTGLKPELGLGYGDFTMTPETTYTVHLAEGGEPVANLTANECESRSGDRFWGSWKLVFAQP